jgi:phosphopantothenate-cysteine ligase
MFGDYDAVVLAAAVSDYDVVNKVDGKIRTKVNLTIELKPLPKLISRVRAWRHPLSSHMTLVGFKLLVSSTMAELTDAARASMVSNQCDIVIANDLRDIKASKHMILIVKPDLTMTAHSHPSDPNALARRVIREIEGDHEWHLKKD